MNDSPESLEMHEYRDCTEAWRKAMSERSRLVLFGLVAVVCCLMVSACASTGAARGRADIEPVPALAGREPTVLVCPIDCISSDAEIFDLSLVLAPLIRRDLFCVQRISVIPTEDTDVGGKAFFLNEDGLRRIGRLHGADMVAFGFLRGEATGISIELAVFDLTTNYRIFNTTVKGKPSQIFKMERQLVYRFIETLGIKLSKEEQERMNHRSPSRIAAAKYFGSGLKSEMKGQYAEALMAFAEAVSKDDELSVPYAAEARVFEKYNAPLRAMESYENAVARDEYFAEGWYQLNLYAVQYKQSDMLAKDYCEKPSQLHRDSARHT
jgi:TolB-like protein